MFSHIVRQRLSNEAENVATEALAFIVNGSDGARSGLLKLVRGIYQGIPDLQFTTQSTIEGGRPDMAGSDGASTFVFIENKFWAGLTEQQPVEYVRALAADVGTRGVVLFVAPAARATSVWGELVRRLHVAGVICEEATSPPGVLRVARTSVGPSMALTSWTQLLAALTLEAAGDTDAIADIDQLRALCDLTDRTAWKPFSPNAVHLRMVTASIGLFVGCGQSWCLLRLGG